MELNLSKQTVAINEVAYEGSMELPVESDVLLPDYCPDIMKILHCFVSTRVTGTQVSGEKLTVDLSCTLKIYYLGADKTMRCNEQRLPYTKTCDIKSAAENAVVDVCCKTDYVNCRAVNQRRFEVRAAVSLFCRVFSRTSTEIVCDAEGGGIQLRTAESDITEIEKDVSRQFSQHEDLALSASKPPIQGIIRQDCFCAIGEHKVISGKVIVKGELMIHLLYQPDTAGAPPESMEYALPVSHIVDAENVDEGCQCEVELSVVSSELTPKANLDGESRMFALDCVLRSRVRTHRRRVLNLITDCYSTDYECRVDRTPISCLNLIKIVSEKAVHKGEITVPGVLSSVLDMFCHVKSAVCKIENGAVVAVVSLAACLFACDENGEAGYYEEPGECEIRIPVDTPAEGILFMPHACVLSCSYSMTGSHLEYRCELALSGCVYATQRPRVATTISCDTSKPRVKSEEASLIVCYAAAGEDVWEIARRYNTSLSEVMSENSLEAAVLSERRMLLIPIV